jgi:tetratricopeptide (TPR) repeat protein
MTRYLLIVYFFFFIINLDNQVKAKENFFNEAKILYDKNKNQESKFLLQRNIVFNPKDYTSYLYLAKIYKKEDNQVELEKNLDTTILLDPKNEEALYMLIELEIEKSNFSEVKKINEIFLQVCINLCDKKKLISEKIKSIVPKNESN